MSRPIIPAILLLTALAPVAQAQTTALERLEAYIEIDTTNPPGNETRGVAFFAAILDAVGIPYETAEIGRAHV